MAQGNLEVLTAATRMPLAKFGGHFLGSKLTYPNFPNLINNRVFTKKGTRPMIVGNFDDLDDSAINTSIISDTEFGPSLHEVKGIR